MVVENLEEYGDINENFTVRVQSNPDSYLVFGMTEVCGRR